MNVTLYGDGIRVFTDNSGKITFTNVSSYATSKTSSEVSIKKLIAYAGGALAVFLIAMMIFKELQRAGVV